MKTTLAKDAGTDREWFLMDAEGQTLGRMAVTIADVLRGKNRPTFTPHVDTGSFVVVVNAQKVRLTGRKNEQKEYLRFSGYRGGLKRIPAAAMRERHPDRMIKIAVKGMLPNNNIARKWFRRLKVYAGDQHPHAAQKLVKL